MQNRIKVQLELFERRYLDDVVDLWNLVFKGRRYFYPMSRERFEKYILKNRDFNLEGCVVAVSKSRVVGFGLAVIRSSGDYKLDINDLPGFISILFVSPEFRHKGVGTMILNFLEGFILESGKGESQVGYPYNPICFSPGVDMSTYAFRFFLNRGYRLKAASLHMELNLKDFYLREKISRYLETHRRMGITYRICNEKDRESLYKLMDHFPGWYSRVREALESESPREVLVAVHHTKVIGFVGPIWLDDRRGCFTGIGVHPQYRRRKIGTVLFNLLCSKLKEMGASYITLHTGTSNPAQEIYFDAGFKVKSVWATKMLKRLKGCGDK
ncbi:GNAT family N-acetyltransferase [Candidatus Bathyarchaeota archaeon]|nr:MAG: GNAT family N-acetyltransferase [Candidatus Bathyarchaeota archaeon]